MKGKDLLDKINYIDDDLIEEAANIKRKRKAYRKSYAIVASLCVVLIGTLLYTNYNVNNKLDNNVDNVTESGIKIDEIINSQEGENSFVYVPRIELSKAPNSMASMIGFIVYKGNIYTEAEYFLGEDTIKVNNLIGKRLGYAKGNIDEWSKQEEYSEEFTGSALGDVYTVNGYSEDFRICIKRADKDLDGKEVEFIQFYENLNGIGLNTGKDLFRDRLKLDGKWGNVKYLTHEDWNYGPEYNYLDLPNITEADINKFINELYNGEFVDLQKTDIYDKPSHHLYVYMNDNTRVELRLFEGGYVGYQPLGWYFVKMPGEIFDKFYNASE